MIAVACGMADEGGANLNQSYERYKNFCIGMGVSPLSERDWINNVVVGNQNLNREYKEI